MLKTITDDQAKLSLLGNYLENIKGTVFRQTQFAEFELRAHEMAEKGLPLTGESLDKLYADIHQAVLRPRPGRGGGGRLHRARMGLHPALLPDLYVFQYATSFTASSALADKVLTGDPAALKRYLAFLSSGGSNYPIALLKEAGVDMTTDEPLELTIKKMNQVMDQMEALLK